MNYLEIYEFWFSHIEENSAYADRMAAKWFGKNEEFDQIISQKYQGLISQALEGELDHWAQSPQGIVSLIIVLDQFSRNAFRGTEKMYAFDHKALAWCKYGLSQKIDLNLTLFERLFIYLPLEHSEDLKDQKLCVTLFQQALEDYRESNLSKVGEGYYNFAKKHYDIVLKFGRFPHRNDILGRESTPREKEFLKKPGSGF